MRTIRTLLLAFGMIVVQACGLAGDQVCVPGEALLELLRPPTFEVWDYSEYPEAVQTEADHKTYWTSVRFAWNQQVLLWTWDGYRIRSGGVLEWVHKSDASYTGLMAGSEEALLTLVRINRVADDQTRESLYRFLRRSVEIETEGDPLYIKKVEPVTSDNSDPLRGST